MPNLDRRRFLSLTAAGVAATSLPSFAMSPAATEDFSFLFLTDTHIQPELHATEGCSMAFKKARTLHADFAIQGGDHIFDGLAVPLSRSQELFHLYGETEQQLSLKVYHTMGNHDVIGLFPKSRMNLADPSYGKSYFEDKIGPRYQSFDHKGVHFIILDSIGFAPERTYFGFLDEGQLQWLRADLAKVSATTPVILVSHIPLITAYGQYSAPPATPPVHNGLSVSNTYEILPLLAKHNVIGVLQGHTHVNERVEFNGISYITGGAVSGNWWKGIHEGTPEGFTVCTVKDGKLTTRYETYGFHADSV
jgi:3',5'-cyclic AMP phosphodiesterase CpdA